MKSKRFIDEYMNQYIVFGGETWRRIEVIEYLNRVGIKDGTPAYFRYMNAQVVDWADYYPTTEPGGNVVPWSAQGPISETVPF
jgi:hypothetical protein